MKSDGSEAAVRFLPRNVTAMVRPGATLMDASLLCGAWIDAPCGGGGRCGKCVVRVSGEVRPPLPAEAALLGEEALAAGLRLACHAEVVGACTVETGSAPSRAACRSLLAPEVPLNVDLPLDSVGRRAEPLGAAVDVGTTTLSVSLISLSSGERLGVSSAENPQTRFGADVMTRIDLCRRDPQASASMREAVLSSLDLLTRRVCASAGRSPNDILRSVVVGNTTMLLLVAGEDPSPLGTSPFEPPVRGPLSLDARRFGVTEAGESVVLLPPVISGFLGADIVAAALATGTGGAPGTAMVVDLGTNGEVALARDGRLLACSTAAGPALEGAGVSSGMRAGRGAIESFSRDGRLTPRVIGGGPPEGICGSGLLDAVAALLEAGLLNPSGRLAAPRQVDGLLGGRIRESASGREFLLSPGGGLTLTQEDVRRVQLAKGAVAAGIRMLCSRLSLEVSEIECVYLAGAFGSFLKPSSALATGLLPGGLAGRVTASGNSALTGAEMMTASESRWRDALDLAGRAEAVELSGDPLFERIFIEELPFPG